jgi:hypothetical protein
MPCVHLNAYGPESAGDDAALIQRKASFDTRRADRELVMPQGKYSEPINTFDASVAQRQSATLTPWKSEGQHLPDALGRKPPTWWMEPDGEAGGRGPPRREFDSPHSPWV